MKKAVLANRIYLNVDEKLKKYIEEETTHTIPPQEPGGLPQVIRNMVRMSDTMVNIPIGRTDLIPPDYQVVDKRAIVPAKLPEFSGTLRESQQEIYDEVEGNCIINAKPSFGKTYTALALAGKLKQKTLVVVHTLSLLDQWVRECEKVYGFKPGIIGKSRKELDTPIVIGSVRSLYNCVDEVSKEFGLLILDEMHHCSAPTFAKIVDKSRAKYKIGLSGTIFRKDGKHVVFRDYFGDHILQPPDENRLTPEVHIINSSIRFLDGGMPWAKRVNKLLYNEEYIELIAGLAKVYERKGHSVLVLGDRTEFLEKVSQLCGDSSLCVTGSTKDRETLLDSVYTREKTILCGTQSIFAEGFSNNTLSCLILGTPVNNEPLLEQLIGRIVRLHDDKKLKPVVLDINLQGNTAKKQAMNRRGFYLKEGYQIISF